jgi:hypothetical protein
MLANLSWLITRPQDCQPCLAVGPVIKDSKRLPERVQPRNIVLPCSRPHALFMDPRFRDVRRGVGFLVMLGAFLHHLECGLGQTKVIDEGQGDGLSMGVPATAEPMHRGVVSSKNCRLLT